jgi:hypothetical protein
MQDIDYCGLLELPRSASPQEIRQRLHQELQLWSWCARSPFFSAKKQAEQHFSALMSAQRALADLDGSAQMVELETVLPLGFPLGIGISHDDVPSGLVRLGRQIVSMPEAVYSFWLAARQAPLLPEFERHAASESETVEAVIEDLMALGLFILLPQRTARAEEVLKNVRILPFSQAAAVSERGVELESASGMPLVRAGLEVYLTFAYSDGWCSIVEASCRAAKDLGLPSELILGRNVEALPVLVRSHAVYLDAVL